MKRQDYPTPRQYLKWAILAAVLLFGGVLLHSSPGFSQAGSCITVTAEHMQNFDLVMDELRTLGLSDSEFARLLALAMSSASENNCYHYELYSEACEAEFYQLDPGTQLIIEEFLVQLPVPSPETPVANCFILCPVGFCWASGTYGCKCKCNMFIFAKCWCTSPTEERTWGLIKEFYRH